MREDGGEGKAERGGGSPSSHDEVPRPVGRQMHGRPITSAGSSIRAEESPQLAELEEAAGVGSYADPGRHPRLDVPAARGLPVSQDHRALDWRGLWKGFGRRHDLQAGNRESSVRRRQRAVQGMGCQGGGARSADEWLRCMN